MKLTPSEFFATYKNYAIRNQLFNGVPASITLAQSALESGWAGSGLTQIANNFFGIKNSSAWNGATYSTETGEYYPSTGFIVKDAEFRAYKTPYASFKDHSKFLKENQRYSGLFNLSLMDYKGWANGLSSAGYATDPSYANKLIGVIEKYDLTKYDKRANYFKLGILGAGILLLGLFVYRQQQNANA